MPRYDFTTQRLFVRATLTQGVQVALDRAQSNYLLNVLRMQAGARVLVFNGADGEWLAEVAPAGRRDAALMVGERTREQTARPDLHLLFAPLKQARLDYMVQKAVEMGVGVLRPVLTQHTQVTRLNLERMEANVVEAAEQCGVLALPEVRAPASLKGVLAEWEERHLIFCDEDERASPAETLSALSPGPLAVLIGPEGGFSAEEREHLRAIPTVRAIGLGPRILRSETAAVAALAVVQSALGDWR